MRLILSLLAVVLLILTVVLLIFYKTNLSRTQKTLLSVLTIFVGCFVFLILNKDVFFGCKSCFNNNTSSTEKFLKENFTSFRFLGDAANVAANPETYCGSDLLVPEEYDRMGTRFQCLKKGIGIGMAMPNAQRDAIINRPPTLIGPRPNVYCGNGDVLPPNYTSLGNPYQCLRKGVGAGMRLPDAQRLAFQQRPPRPLGKKEIMTLAKRLGITTHDKTRAQTLARIAERL